LILAEGHPAYSAQLRNFAAASSRVMGLEGLPLANAACPAMIFPFFDVDLQMEVILSKPAALGLGVYIEVDSARNFAAAAQGGSRRLLGEGSTKDPTYRKMIARINFYVDPEAESAGLRQNDFHLKIHVKNGKIIAGQAAFAKGSPSNPMTLEEAAAKFRSCAEYAGWPSAKIKNIIAFVRSMESASDISALSPLLSTEKG